MNYAFEWLGGKVFGFLSVANLTFTKLNKVPLSPKRCLPIIKRNVKLAVIVVLSWASLAEPVQPG